MCFFFLLSIQLFLHYCHSGYRQCFYCRLTSENIKRIIMIVFILVLLTKVCLGNEADNDGINDTILPDLLINVGEKIKKELTSPTEKKGKQLIQDMFDYYNYIDDINKLLDSEFASRQQRGKEIYRMIFDKGGPPFINMEINYDELMTKYKWEPDDRDINSAKEAIKDIKEHWEFVGENEKTEKTTKAPQLDDISLQNQNISI